MSFFFFFFFFRRVVRMKQGRTLQLFSMWRRSTSCKLLLLLLLRSSLFLIRKLKTNEGDV